MPRILDVNYKEYESIPFWKDIVAGVITEYFQKEGDQRVSSIKISSIGQLIGKRFRVEIRPDRAFNKDHLSSLIIKALRDEEVEVIAYKEIESITDYLIETLRDEKIAELVSTEHDGIRDSLEIKFQEEKRRLLGNLDGIDKDIARKFNAYELALSKEREDFNNVINEVNGKLKGYDKLKSETTDVVENHKNFDGIALGVAAASMLTSLMIILFLLLG